VNANCTNTVGGHNCSCKEGFAGDGRSCLGKLILYFNLLRLELIIGVPRLMSTLKRIKLSFSIVDIDECITGNHECDVNANCTNTVGGHNCTCKGGFAGDGRSCSGKLTLLQRVKGRTDDWSSTI